MKITSGEIRKGIAAMVGAAGEVITAGLVSGNTAKWIEVVIGFVTALGVILVPNDQPVPPFYPATPPNPPVVS